jgi:hypothetical protein
VCTHYAFIMPAGSLVLAENIDVVQGSEGSVPLWHSFYIPAGDVFFQSTFTTVLDIYVVHYPTCSSPKPYSSKFNCEPYSIYNLYILRSFKKLIC